MQMRSLIRAKYKSEKPGEYLCLLSEDPPKCRRPGPIHPRASALAPSLLRVGVGAVGPEIRSSQITPPFSEILQENHLENRLTHCHEISALKYRAESTPDNNRKVASLPRQVIGFLISGESLINTRVYTRGTKLMFGERGAIGIIVQARELEL